MILRSVKAVGCLLLAVMLSGCLSSRNSDIVKDRGKVVLPVWFTQPSGAEQANVPVNMGMAVPRHLRELAETYGQPGWLVYGVVRALGADEFLANGTVKTFSVQDENGESRVVADNVYYDVDRKLVHRELGRITAGCANAETERERLDMIGRHVIRRYGGFILFSLGGEAAGGNGGGPPENLLLTSGEGLDPVETFRADGESVFPKVGWQETGSHYVSTMAGDFRYGNPIEAFRRTEEEAISDLAKGLVLKFSHMRKEYQDSRSYLGGEVEEQTTAEEIKLRMRGVRVTRRMVNLREGLCVVVVQVPRNGVALR